jgi:hypothetical protein
VSRRQGFFNTLRSFRDTKGRFGLLTTQVGSAEQLGRLVVGLTLELAWPTLAVLPEVRAKPDGWSVSVALWGSPA